MQSRVFGASLPSFVLMELSSISSFLLWYVSSSFSHRSLVEVHCPMLSLIGYTVITEISSANGYKNPTSSNSYEVTHGPKLPQKHFQKVQNYTTSDKIKVRYDYTGRARTCAKQKRRKSAHAHRCTTVVAKSRTHLRTTHL
jgi:hypothetical protein